MDSINPLKLNELYLSGAFTQKFNEKYSSNRIPCPSFLKACYSFDGYEISVDDKNFVKVFGFLSEIGQEKVLTGFDNYIKRIVDFVKDEKKKEKIIKVANNNVSRQSHYHILNIELLVSLAIKNNTLRFNCLYDLVCEKDFYQYAGADYEYFLFAIFDAQDENLAVEFYEYIYNNCLSPFDEDTGFRQSKVISSKDLKDIFNRELSDDAKEKLDDNLKLLKLKNMI